MLRVLHCPVNVGNQPWTLSRAERRLGVHSDLVVNYATWLLYPADRVLGTHGGKKAGEMIRRLAFGLTAPFRYDVLHYYFGRSLLYWDDIPRANRLPFADLKLARRLNRKVFMTLQGCDVRLARESNRRYELTPCAEGRCSAYQACLSTYDARRRSLIDSILPLCDQIFFLNPELGHYIGRGQFLPYANVDVARIELVSPRATGVPRIVHAPSDGSIKGTPSILKALDLLQQHFAFELILVQNKPHHEAMEIYRSADLVIDQVLAGWYGGFAVELMAMGKPVVCYIREKDLGVVPAGMRGELPLLQVREDSLTDDLATILGKRSEWREYGLASRRYVERWHDPATIARAMIAAYSDTDSKFELEQVR